MKAQVRLDFNANQLNNNIKTRIIKSLYKTGVKIGQDSQEIPPKPPVREGTLRGSMNIEVDKDNFLVRVSYNTAYAARWHENPFQPHLDPDSGMKYLEAKLIRFRNNYLEFFRRQLGL